MNDDGLDFEVNVPPEWQAGVYANFAAVSNQTPHDFTLDFVQLVPGQDKPEAHLVARIKLAPSFLMPLMQALATQQTGFEQAIRQLQEQQEGEESEPS